ELGVRTLPQEEIGEPLLPAGPDEEIHVGSGPAVDRAEPPGERAVVEIGEGGRTAGGAEGAGGPDDGIAGRVVHGQPQSEGEALGGGGLGRGNGHAKRRGGGGPAARARRAPPPGHRGRAPEAAGGAREGPPARGRPRARA